MIYIILERQENTDVFYMLCGDMNSSPSSGIYQFLNEGFYDCRSNDKPKVKLLFFLILLKISGQPRCLIDPEFNYANIEKFLKANTAKFINKHFEVKRDFIRIIRLEM